MRVRDAAQGDGRVRANCGVVPVEAVRICGYGMALSWGISLCGFMCLFLVSVILKPHIVATADVAVAPIMLNRPYLKSSTLMMALMKLLVVMIAVLVCCCSSCHRGPRVMVDCVF